MSNAAEQSLRNALLEPISGSEQAARWCAESAQWVWPLQSCLQRGQRSFSFSPAELGADFGLEPGFPLPAELFWTQTYKRQTGCPGDFAWLDLHAVPWASDHVVLVFAFEQVLPQWGGSGRPLAEDREILWLLPALLKGLIDGLRAEKHRGLRLEITGMRVHLVDSRPSSFYRCGLQALAHLSRSNTGLL